MTSTSPITLSPDNRQSSSSSSIIVLDDSPIAPNTLTPIFLSDTPEKVRDRDSAVAAQSSQRNSRRQLEFSKEFLDLIDDPPLPPDRPAIPSVGLVVRKRDERRKLHGYECNCCKKYYDGLQLTPKSRQQRINQVSRHRAHIPMPMTPKHYWEVGMPDRDECIRRGYLKIATSPYRRRDKKPSELMRKYEMRLRRERNEARERENDEIDRLRRSENSTSQ